jgi:phosphate transport system substrate-binding protein
MKFFKKPFLALALVSALGLAACGGNTDQAGENEATEKLSGEIKIDGSSTVFPIMEAVSEEYTAEQPDVKAPIGVSGTGGGFKKFVVGETDLSNASRPIKDEEAAQAQENNVEYIELALAYDGLSVVVNKENDFVDNLTHEELMKMWTEEGGVKTWKDIRAEWPAEPIKFFSPGVDSGTYDYWNDTVLEKKPMRKDAQLSEDDNVLVTGVSGEKNAIGFFGYAYYIENKDKLKVVHVVNKEGKAVAPSEDTIQSGEYNPLSRPIFTYVNKKSLEKPEVLDYVKFMNETVPNLVSEVGYVPLPTEKYEENSKLIEEATKK